MQLWVIWLIVAGVLLVAEMLTLTFYLLWLGVGALVAAIVALIVPDAFAVQVIVGCAVAVVLTLLSKPLTRRFRGSRGFRDAIDELVGKHGVVVEAIGPDRMGIVKVGSETWSAKSPEPLASGANVIVVSRSSTVLEVYQSEGE
ncbi:MAG: NfeD family protein [Paenibacillaceae bacterium]|nr:NfeD family protein [Paenibacillaceae bacterium]